jgi:hypothetical protein
LIKIQNKYSLSKIAEIERGKKKTKLRRKRQLNLCKSTYIFHHLVLENLVFIQHLDGEEISGLNIFGEFNLGEAAFSEGLSQLVRSHPSLVARYAHLRFLASLSCLPFPSRWEETEVMKRREKADVERERKGGVAKTREGNEVKLSEREEVMGWITVYGRMIAGEI